MILPEQILAEANRMGAMPPCLPKLMSMLGSEDVDLGKVEALLSGEAALVAALLRRANSAAMGARVEIGTVRDAIMRLGAPTALSVMVEVCLRGQKQRPEPIYGVPPEIRWQLSIAASLVARELYGNNPSRFATTVVTAALLHDIGRLPLANLMSAEAMTEVMRFKALQSCTLVEAERHVVGLDGCLSGALVAKEWGFPQELVHALGGWADPDNAQGDMSDAVHISAVLARMIAGASGARGIAMKPVPTAAQRLGLDKALLGQIAAKVTQQYAEVAAESAPNSLDLDAA